jgi:hypothetical protein
MAAAVVNRPRFVVGPVLKPAFPRPPPPKDPQLGYGDSCFRAQCFLASGDDTLATFSGYDTSIGIVEEVENACRHHAATRPGSSCSPIKLTFLPYTRRECSGQLYFTFE